MRTWPLLLLLAAPALAQTHTATAPEPTGAVSGHVYCGDTNQPARFAHVSLEAIPDASVASTSTKPSAHSNAATSVETSLDGSYTLSGVRPGSYYVIVELTGYIKPRDIFTKEQIADPAPAMRALVAAALPHVTVESGHTEQAEVRLDRGAAISGTILYDDGSPASDIEVKLLHKDATGKWVPLNGDADIFRDGTDDRGYFRLAGLLGGEYLVEADLRLTGTKNVSTVADANGHSVDFAMMNILSMLPFYGNGTPRKSRAASIKLAPGQELPGQDMTLPLAKLHKLSGRVAAGNDAHIVNAATVALVTRDDNQQIATTDITRDDDGVFRFEFVPEDDYLLRITNARDVTWEAPAPVPASGLVLFPPADKEHVIASYGNVDQPLLLSGDRLDVVATVPPSTAPTAPASPPQP